MDDLLRDVAGAVLLELKGADMAALTEHYGRLLSDLMVEMRAQFDLFKALRAGAEALMGGEDEAAAKQARADLKAASDAISVIVRTLEKIDQLQRQLVRDRAMEDERALDAEPLQQAEARLLALVEAQAEARARVLLEEWQAGGAGVPDG
ncbi:hypothetical protein [Rhizobium paknamense]|uniref:Uncharacterized protein n=1 Tax=Rhizobium paknamense TaxID=1206817 RepID=A0ABU0IA00_9HYPH|nr:hypothetical protein [Rhizobium paknamense]MDQ0454295.1 hypothetical protein [Rhizobium paknamense]